MSQPRQIAKKWAFCTPHSKILPKNKYNWMNIVTLEN